MKRYLRVALIAAAASACSQGALAQSAAIERASAPAQLGLSIGPVLDYSSGKYGTDSKTDIWSAGLGARYETGRWTARVTVPYINVTGRGDVVPAGGAGSSPVCVGSNRGPGNNTGRCDDSTPNTGGGTTTTRRSDSGLGDVTASLAYNLLDDRKSGWIVDVTGRLKLPTADETKGLGTGKTDYALQTDVDKRFGDVTVFGTVGYRWYGDPPGRTIRDVFYGALGTSYRVSPGASVGVAYDQRQSTTGGVPGLREVSLFTSLRVTQASRLRMWVFKGLTDGTADWGLGGSLFVSF